MKFDLHYDGETYPYETDELTLAEAMSVKVISGFSAGQFVSAIFAIEPRAWLAMYVLALRRAGKRDTNAEDIDQDKIDVLATAEQFLNANPEAAARVGWNPTDSADTD